MINIISKIFTEKGFQINGIEEFEGNYIEYKENSERLQNVEGLFAQNNDKSLYYIFDFNEEVNISSVEANLQEKQEKYYNYMMNMNESNIIKQNCSFISCIQVDSIKEVQQLKNSILELEEDRYFFKKYIIVFTKNEILDLKAKISSRHINDFIAKQIEDIELFDNFKKGNNDNYYSLLLKLLIKIPSLTYGIKINRSLSSLQVDIDEVLKEKYYYDLKMESMKIGDDNEEIDSFIDNLLLEEKGGIE